MATVSEEIIEEVIQRTKRYMEGQKDIGDTDIKDTAGRFLTELIGG